MTIKLSLITAESMKVKQGMGEYPCVVLFGRDSEGKKYKWRTKFYPYLYINESDHMKLLDEEFNLDAYIREAVGTSKRGLTKRALTKLILKNTSVSAKLTRLLRKRQVEGVKDTIYTYEGDLATSSMLALRYIIDKNIRSGFSIEDDGTVKAVDMPSNLRVWFIDFEAYSTKMCGHGPKKDEPITMVTIWDTHEKELYTLYARNPKWKYRVRFNPIVEHHTIKGFKTEASLLDYLVEMVIKNDPDLISAWNLDRYDIVQWKLRMEALGKKCLYDFKSLSPLKGISFSHKPYRIKGRILFDLMKAMKKFTQAELRSYSLGSVAKEESMDLEKVPFKGTVANTWDKYPQVMFKRNVNDVLILKALDEKYELVEMFNDLRTEFGALFHEVLMNYRVLDTALLRFINKKLVLRTATRGKSEGKFLGAIVVEPKVGSHTNIGQWDFTREYPNIMKLFNISPETYRKPDYKGECYTIKYKNKEGKILVFKFVKRPIGLLPQLIDFFFNKRDLYEKEYAKAIAAKDEVKIKMWWRRIFNIKTMTNAIYGVMDFPSFRLSKKECSAAVAVIGRISIEKLKKIALRLGYELIYGDTDSIFVRLKGKFGTTKEAYLKETQWLTEQFNKGLTKFFTKEYRVDKAPSVLGIQKIYSRYMLWARKMYAGKQIYDSKKGWKEDFDFKGLEIIRSDSSDLEKEVLTHLVKLHLDGKRKTTLDNYIQGVYEEYWVKHHDPISLAYPLQIKRPWIQYIENRIPAHVRAAMYSNKFLNTDFESGDKPRRLSIIGPSKSKRKLGKKDEGQSTLFNEVSYPLVWKYKDNKWMLKDISIAEDMLVPQWFIDRIDWVRIFKRLDGKVNKVMNLIEGVQ